MSPVYVLWVVVLNAVTGDVVTQGPASDPVSLEECLKEQAGRISVAKDGKVEQFVCVAARPVK